MGFHITPSELSALMQEAQSVIDRAHSSTENLSDADKVKQAIIGSSDKLQKILNSLLATNGLISDTDAAALNEQLQETKLQTLAQESRNNFKKYAIYGGGIVLLLGILWYVTRKKN
jgi:hypothetical protein